MEGEMSNYGMHRENDQENIKQLRRLEKEEVTNPKHYNELKSEPLDYIIANELDFLEGNIVKYVSRYTYKGGVNDLLKFPLLDDLLDCFSIKTVFLP